MSGRPQWVRFGSDDRVPVYELHCTIPECDSTQRFVGCTLREMAEQLEQDGWAIIGYAALCPGCNPTPEGIVLQFPPMGQDEVTV